MKNKLLLSIILLLSSCVIYAQSVFSEDFELEMQNTQISFQSVGSFNSPPGIKNFTSFNSNKAFGFGSSVCGSSCFDSYQTTLTITLPHPTHIISLSWNEMEINGNWGSQGTVLLDGVVLANTSLGAMPVNSGVADASPRSQNIAIDKVVKTISFVVTDITSASEILIDDILINGTIQIVGYEYWFNNDFVGKISVSDISSPQLNIDKNIETNHLTNGINVLNFRAFDNRGHYSALLSHYFYKTSPSENNLNPTIIAYEYWLNNDYASATTVNVSSIQQVNINELISTVALNSGVNVFNIRFKDNSGLWSSILSNIFYKLPNVDGAVENKIEFYRYWFNDDFNQATTIGASTTSPLFNLTENINVAQLPVGEHTIHFQFKDANGLWSVVTSDIFDKTLTSNIIDNSLNSNVLVFPNPTNGKVQIDLKEIHNAIEVTIHDIKGRLVQRHFYTNQQKIELNFSEPPGIYILKISSKDKNTTVRLTKH